VAVAAVGAVAAVHGFLGSGSRDHGTFVAGVQTTQHGAAAGGGGTREAHSLQKSPPVFQSATTDSATSLGGFAPAVPAPTGRLTDYQATIRVRVRDLDRLTDATADAVRIVRALGGYAASVNTTTGNGPGQSYLELRVPASRVQDALLRLAGLGTVVSQQLSQQDLEAVVARQNAKIAALRRAIHRYEVALAQPGLPADVRVRLQIQLDDAKLALRQRTHKKNATLKEAATAKISLELTTERNASAPPAKGRFDRAIGGALGFLAAAAAVGLALAIGAAPFLVLLALALAGRRAWRRREEQRLLAAQ
jgi:hypothetical protein